MMESREIIRTDLLRRAISIPSFSNISSHPIS
jgi:hypothetical protein